MTRYHFDNKQRKSNTSRKKFIGFFFVIVVIVVLIIFFIAPLLQKIARGPQWVTQQVSKSSILSSKSSLVTENNSLKESIISYKAQLLELQIIRDENEKLRTELSYRPVLNSSITAQVIAKPSQSLYNSLIIDQGSSQGVRVGQLVTVQQTIGLGRIVQVSANTATIQLFSGPDFKGDVIMKNQNITVPAVGKGGGNFEIHIPREITVMDGDILTFPESPNIAIGVIKSITFDPRDPFQTVLARTPINIQELRFVDVVK